MPQRSRTPGEDLCSDQNGNAIMKMQEEDEEDDVPLHKRRDISVAIPAPKDTGVYDGAKFDTGVDETRSSTLSVTRKRKLKTHDSAKTTHSNLKKRRENENL